MAVGPVSAQDLGFERRVQAQEALERAIYSHEMGSHRPFEEAVPRALLEAKVRTYLERSLALAELWKTYVVGRGSDRERESYRGLDRHTHARLGRL